VPNRFWKLGQFIFYYVYILDLLIKKSFFNKNTINIGPKKRGNNLKPIKEYGRIRKVFFPVPHGNFSSNLKEFIAYGRDRWIKKFENENFLVIKTIKGPVTSGYGFGLNKLRSFLERIGFSSVYIFILKKK
jgi:hypothetical protein